VDEVADDGVADDGVADDEERLEADLRRVLGHPRHALPARGVTVEGIHLGARRRRRARLIAALGAVLAVAVLVGSALALAGSRDVPPPSRVPDDRPSSVTTGRP
jgi:hypothetical protein